MAESLTGNEVEESKFAYTLFSQISSSKKRVFDAYTVRGLFSPSLLEKHRIAVIASPV